jgi:Cysteine-rich CPCC
MSERGPWTGHLTKPAQVVKVACPCCGQLTLSARAQFAICSVCNWQDDGQDDDDADVVRGGPNGSLSLTAAREKWRRQLETQTHVCSDGWICEQHPERGWPHDECAGPGMPCLICNRASPPRLPSGWKSYARVKRERQS